jgi:hypothetical protein
MSSFFGTGQNAQFTFGGIPSGFNPLTSTVASDSSGVADAKEVKSSPPISGALKEASTPIQGEYFVSEYLM